MTFGTFGDQLFEISEISVRRRNLSGDVLTMTSKTKVEHWIIFFSTVVVRSSSSTFVRRHSDPNSSPGSSTHRRYIASRSWCSTRARRHKTKSFVLRLVRNSFIEISFSFFFGHRFRFWCVSCVWSEQACGQLFFVHTWFGVCGLVWSLFIKHAP